MTSSNGLNNEAETVTFFKNLFNRRVPHILGFYLGGSWGIIQFVEWIVNRYLLSPHLVDLAFVILISLVPSIVVVAYFHGAPGRNRWRTPEKISIPVNVLLTIVLLMFVFEGKDLGHISQKVTLQDETGKKIQRVIPKTEYRKKIALFFFDNTSKDHSLDWLQYGIIYMLTFDLQQDLFMDIISPAEEGLRELDYYVLNKIKKAGYQNGVGLPLLLKRKIARECYMDYFISGEINKEKGDIIFEISLYRSQDAKQVAATSFRGKEKDIFQWVDHMTVWIKKKLEIPAGHIEAVNDLPTAEMFTRSIPAARASTFAANAAIFENDWAKAQDYLNTALREDPGFTSARVQLVSAYVMTNQTEKVHDLFQTVMQQLYKLPERSQFYVKFFYYAVKQEPEKQIAVLRMITKLYPQDIKAYSALAFLFGVRNRHDEAIVQYKRILEIDPRRFEVLQSIGEQYEAKGDLQQALASYKKYAGHLPNNPDPFISLGDLYKKMGDNHQAKSHYEKALLIKPDDVSVLVKLAGIEAKLGQFDKADQQYREALNLSKIPKDKAAVYEGLADLCEMRGQVKKSFEYNLRSLALLKEFRPPILVSFSVIFSIDKYIQAGKEKEAFQTLETLKQDLQPPYDRFVIFGYLRVYLDLKRANEAEKLLPVVEEIVQTTGSRDFRYFAYLASGRIHQLRGEYTEAIEDFRKGLEIRPLKGKLLLAIGVCHRELKQYDKAENVLQTFLKQEPYHPGCHHELALLYLDMGNKEEALKHVNAALEVWQDADPGYKPAQMARMTLEQLQQN